MNDEYQRKRQQGSISPLDIVVLFALLLLPLLAVLRLAGLVSNPRWLLGYVALISIATYVVYYRDKKKAQAGEWRTPEATLHFLELLGGWPGAFLAQRAFRHKTSKTRFLVNYWAIVALHEYASFDFLHNWAYSINALRLLFE